MIPKEAIEAACKELLAHGEFGTSSEANHRNAEIAAQAALTAAFAAMSEPVGYIDENGARKLGLGSPTGIYAQPDEYAVIPLYAAPQPAAVKVKPLEWVEITSPREDGAPEATSDVEACTMIGEYSVCFDEDEAVSDTPWCCWSPVECIGHFDNFEAAKAAAQSDYEKRILSALEGGGE